MEKKYIIVIETQAEGHTTSLHKAKDMSVYFSDEDMKKLLPYVEPDLDAVRTKAFQEAYDYVKKEDADALERMEYLIQRIESVKKEAYELGYDNAMSALQNKRNQNKRKEK